MFRLDSGLPSELARWRGSTPTQLRRKMEQVEKSARRLLEHLGVPHDEPGNVKIEEAYDGPDDNEILKVLSWAVEHDEDPVITATTRLGRLAEMIKAVQAAADIQQCAHQGAQKVIELVA